MNNQKFSMENANNILSINCNKTRLALERTILVNNSENNNALRLGEQLCTINEDDNNK